MVSQGAADIVSRLAARGTAVTEADIQADVRSLLLSPDLALMAEDVVKLEVPTADGTRRRIDVEVGQCVIEVKKDLRPGQAREAAEQQLAGYLMTREYASGARAAGVLTDGTIWSLHRLNDGNLQHVTTLELTSSDPDADRLLSWLESVLSTQERVRPTQDRISELLGAGSPAHQLDHATLRSLLNDASSNSEVQLKKGLWAKLLRTAFGDAFIDDDALFVNHTLLVITAEAIAHEIVGFDLAANQISPSDLVTGRKFEDSRVFGVVEEDFFDWVLAAEGGLELIETLMRRIARFDWSSVEHDVLKVLYESVIDSRDRERLGEYYTPDWLAEQMVVDTITTPSTQRVLDPSCGSGTFVFHAVRAHLSAVEEAGHSQAEAVNSVTRHVLGLDIHPVAVTLARVTYLMALGTERILNPNRHPFSVPVFLGDALQWERKSDLLADEGELTVNTEGDDLVSGGGGALFGDILTFPTESWENADTFDKLVRYIGHEATNLTSLDSTAKKRVQKGLAELVTGGQAKTTLYATFETWHRLHHSGRDHIWSYYVRNLVKPLWLTQEANHVDVLIGNPPWLRYSKMTATMQRRYKDLARPRNLLAGGLGASARDLSTLFVVRAIELYLRDGGTFSFVMPHGVLSRRPHQGFRSGHWGGDATGALTATFGTSWDLDGAATGFPMTSCVVHGARAGRTSMAEATRKIATKNVRGVLEITWSDGTVAAIDSIRSGSHYEQKFRQGAIMVPRMLFCVVEEDAGPLGVGAGRTRVRSARSLQEKPPWKGQPDLVGIVETQFLRPMHLGSTIAPFRTLEPWTVVMPATDEARLSHDDIGDHPDLAAWWAQVETVWEDGRSRTETQPLHERVDYHSQLSAQFPLNMHVRVIYPKAGNILCAAIVRDPRVVIDHKLYWASASSLGEAHYLQAMLNSTALFDRVKRYQALGLFGPRDFDKYVFRADFPEYDDTNADHTELVDIASRSETVATAVDLSGARTFQQQRRKITERLTEAGLTEQLNAVANRVLGAPSA